MSRHSSQCFGVLAAALVVTACGGGDRTARPVDSADVVEHGPDGTDNGEDVEAPEPDTNSFDARSDADDVEALDTGDADVPDNGGEDLLTDLVLWMTFDEGAGTTAADSSGLRNHGTLQNGPTWIPGKIGGALEFDGDDDYVEIGQVASGDTLTLADRDVTLAAWVRLAGGGDAYQRVLDKSTEAWAAGGYALALHEGKVELYVGGVAYRSQGLRVEAGSWVHVVGVMSRAGFRVYVNGVLETMAVFERGTETLPPDAPANMRLGTWNHAAERELRGALDDLRIYSRALTEAQVIALYGEEPVRPERYHDYDSTLALVDSLVADHPDIVRRVDYGTSVDGRALYAVKVSDNVDIDEAEPELSYDGGTHGEELIGAEMAVRFLADICGAYGADPEVTSLIDGREIWFFPFFNPDGRQSVRRFNTNGVDLNRDYGYMWDGGGGSRAPFSQPETLAAWRWIDDHQFVLSVHFHGGRQALYTPWGYKTSAPPDVASLRYLAEAYRASSGYPTLGVGQANPDLYATKGTFYDFVYGTRGTLSHLMEVSVDKRPPVADMLRYYEYNRPAMMDMLTRSGHGVQGMVTDIETGDPVAANLWVTRDGEPYWPVINDPVVGDYHKFVTPGTYTVRAVANGYEQGEQGGVVVSDDAAVTVDFQLVPSQSPRRYAHQVELCQIPGFNDEDPNMTPWALGSPDGRRYALGVSGWIVLDLGATLIDAPGDDLRIIEDDGDPEGYTVKVGLEPSGPWTTLGQGRGTGSFDLGATALETFRYVRIEDDGDGTPREQGAGFDLDAVESPWQ